MGAGFRHLRNSFATNAYERFGGRRDSAGYCSGEAQRLFAQRVAQDRQMESGLLPALWRLCGRAIARSAPVDIDMANGKRDAYRR